MNTNSASANLEKRAQWDPMTVTRVCLAAAVLALAGAGCAATSGPPRPQDLLTRGAKQKAVLLVRVITEVEGQIAPPFPSSMSPADNLSLGVGDFSSGGKIQSGKIHFLSDDTRNEGWTYILLEPGQVYYLAARAPMSTSAATYNAQWGTCPRWSIEIPADARLVYGGTLYLPGKGRWMIVGPRKLASFDRAQLAIRDESALASEISRRWFPTLLPMSVQLAKEYHPGDTIILQTPPGK
jgi:hypothetical protein